MTPYLSYLRKKKLLKEHLTTSHFSHKKPHIFSLGLIIWPPTYLSIPLLIASAKHSLFFFPQVYTTGINNNSVFVIYCYKTSYPKALGIISWFCESGIWAWFKLGLLLQAVFLRGRGHLKVQLGQDQLLSSHLCLQAGFSFSWP